MTAPRQAIGATAAAVVQRAQWGARAVLAGARYAAQQYRAAQYVGQADPQFRARWPQIDATVGWTTPTELAMLYHLARFGPGAGDIVEIGSYQGRSTGALGFGALDRGEGVVWAVDPHTGDRSQLEELGIVAVNTAPAFQRTIARLGLEAVARAVVAPSTDAAATYAGQPIRLLFIDGWHSEAAVMADLRAWRPHLASGAVVAFDDYATSDEVRAGIVQLWERGETPRCAFVFGKMIGFCDHRQSFGGLPMQWRTPRR